MKKKLSGDGAVMVGIGQEALGAQIRNLKRVTPNTKEKSEKDASETKTSTTGSVNTVQEKIAAFRFAEKGKNYFKI